MTRDELKKKLRSAWVLQKQLECNYVELQNLRDNAGRITPAYSLAPGGGGTGQRIENAMVKLADLETENSLDIEKLVEALAEIRRLIALVDDQTLRLILHKRYLCYQKWEQIAADLNYSWQWVHKMHGRALREILQKTSD